MLTSFLNFSPKGTVLNGATTMCRMTRTMEPNFVYPAVTINYLRANVVRRALLLYAVAARGKYVATLEGVNIILG